MTDDIVLRDNERIDDLNRAGFRIIQDPKVFCFGMDAVLLASYASSECRAMKKGSLKICDLGTGTGVIPILMAARESGDGAGYDNVSDYDCVEIQPVSVDMAGRSIRLNHLEEHIKVHEGDINDVKLFLKAHSYDCVTSNPPYMSAHAGLKNPSDVKMIARHEILVDLDGICKAASTLLKCGGCFYMVHRPSRLVDIFSSLRKYSMEPKAVRMIHAREGEEANMVLVKARKDAKPQLTVLPPLFIYEDDNEYTKEVRDIYYGE